MKNDQRNWYFCSENDKICNYYDQPSKYLHISQYWKYTHLRRFYLFLYPWKCTHMHLFAGNLNCIIVKINAYSFHFWIIHKPIFARNLFVLSPYKFEYFLIFLYFSIPKYTYSVCFASFLSGVFIIVSWYFLQLLDTKIGWIVHIYIQNSFQKICIFADNCLISQSCNCKYSFTFYSFVNLQNNLFM